MRVSNRDKILDGVVRVIERDGMTGVTFDAVAAETGLTRGGILYHFPAREELILATHRRLAEQWEAELRGFAGPGATPPERYAAYVEASAREPTRAELVMMLESATDPAAGAIWAEVLDRWAPPPPAPENPPGDPSGDAAAMTRFLARLAADGLWAHEAISGQRLPPAARERVGAAILAMIAAPAKD